MKKKNMAKNTVIFSTAEIAHALGVTYRDRLLETFGRNDTTVIYAPEVIYNGGSPAMIVVATAKDES